MCIKVNKNVLLIENNVIMGFFSNMFCIFCFVVGFVMVNFFKFYFKVKGIFKLYF